MSNLLPGYREAPDHYKACTTLCQFADCVDADHCPEHGGKANAHKCNCAGLAERYAKRDAEAAVVWLSDGEYTLWRAVRHSATA